MMHFLNVVEDFLYVLFLSSPPFFLHFTHTPPHRLCNPTGKRGPAGERGGGRRPERHAKQGSRQREGHAKRRRVTPNTPNTHSPRTADHVRNGATRAIREDQRVDGRLLPHAGGQTRRARSSHDTTIHRSTVHRSTVHRSTVHRSTVHRSMIHRSLRLRSSGVGRRRRASGDRRVMTRC